MFAGVHGEPSFAGASATRAQAMAADRAFAQLSVDSGYTIAFTTFASPSAVVVGASDFFWGPAGVAYAYGGWAPGETLDWGPVVGRGAASGDLAYTVGTAVYAYTTAAGAQKAHSKYLTVWVRQADGSWRFVIDGGNASPAPVL